MDIAEKAQPLGPRFITLGLLTMTVRVAQRLWVLRTRDRRFLVSRAHGTVAYKSLELATFFADEIEARTYAQSLEAGTYSAVEWVRLFDLIKETMQANASEGFFKQPPSAPPDLPPGMNLWRIP